MLLTDEQAREKWCPHVRIARDESIRTETDRIGGIAVIREERHIVAGCNTDALGGYRVPASCRCIGSGCAMWRFSETKNQQYISETDDQFNARRTGYCGLAGKP